MKEAIKFGVIYGVLSLLLMLITMSMSTEISFSWKAFAISFVVSMAILIFGGRYFFRKIEDVDLSYGVAVKYLFVASFVGAIVGTVGSMAIYGNDEELKNEFVDYQVEVTESAMRWGLEVAGADEATIESKIEESRDDIESRRQDFADSYPFSFSNIHMSLGSNAVMSLIYALIAAIFVRVKHPD